MRVSVSESTTDKPNILYTAAVELAAKIGIEPSVPRVASRQQHRSNAPSVSIGEHYSRNLILPFLDTIVNEMSDRYNLNLQSSF